MNPAFLSFAERSFVFGLDMFLKAAALLIAALVADWILRRYTLARATLWEASLVALLVLPLAAIWLPPFALKTRIVSRVAQRSEAMMPANERDESRSQEELLLAEARRLSDDNVELRATAVAPLRTAPVQAAISQPARVQVSAVRWMSLFAVGLYLLGASALMIRLAMAYWGVRKLRNRAAPAAREAWLSRLVVWQDKLDIRAPVEIAVSGDVATPLVVGISPPMILLPEAFCATATAPQIDAVLAHELAHARRRDFGWQLLTRSVRAVYWPLPFVWLAARRINASRERACDEYCVWALGGQKEYAQALLQIASTTIAAPRHELGLAMAARLRLADRLEHISQCRANARCMPSPIWRVVGMAIVAGAACIIGAARVQERVRADQPPSAASNDQAKATGAAEDTPGDALPKGVILRLGDPRWQAVGVSGVAFLPGRELMSWDDEAIRFWDAMTGRQMSRIDPPDSRDTTRVALSPDGATMVRATGRHVELWDLKKRLRTWRIDVESEVWAVAYAAESGLVATAGDNGKVKVWSAKNGDPRKFYELGQRILSLAFSAAGELLAAGDGTGQVHLIRPTGDAALTSFRAHGNAVSSAHFLSDNKLLTSGCVDARDPVTAKRLETSQIRIWSVDTKVMLREIGAAEKLQSNCACAVSPDGKWLASLHYQQAAVWNLETGELVHLFDKPGLDAGEMGGARIDISSDGKTVAAAGPHQRIAVWDALTGKEISSEGDHHVRDITAIRYSPDGRFIATGGMDGAVRLWDAETGRVAWSLTQAEPRRDWIRGLAFLEGGKFLAMGVQTSGRADEKGEVRLVDSRSGRILHKVTMKEVIASLSVSPDGLSLAAAAHRWTGGDDPFGGEAAPPKSFVQEWKLDMESLAESRRLEIKAPEIRGVDFLPDGSLVTLDSERELRLWPRAEAESKLIAKPEVGHQSLVISRDGKTALCGGDRRGVADGEYVAAINVETGETIVELLTGGKWPRGIAVSPDGQFAAAYLPARYPGTHHELALWRVQSGEKVASFEVEVGPASVGSARLLDFSPDGRRVVLGTSRGDALIYDVSEAHDAP